MFLSSDREPQPCVLVIFGGSGALTARKIAPALYNLARENRLPDNVAVVGFGRSELSTEAFRKRFEENIAQYSRTGAADENVFSWLAPRIFYQQGNYHEIESFRELGELLDTIDEQYRTDGGRIFYNAIPPQLMSDVVVNLHEAKLLVRRMPHEEEEKGPMRIVLEKPFGRDLGSARKLNRTLEERIEESQIFRMDHYLGKETVQNLLVLRFANSIFEPLWNNRHVAHVHVTVAETAGVEERAGYFENTGALRDVLQNHVLQLLALFTMEPPVSLDPNSIRDAKANVLKSLRRSSEEDIRCSTIRGQYATGEIDGEKVSAYREEKGVATDSNTETFVALRTYIDNWRWSGVPFYLTTGKRLAEQVTEVAIEFRSVPNILFRRARDEELSTNLLKVRVQPEESVTLRICSKQPGLGMHISSEEMHFPCDTRVASATPKAYERLLLDVMAGNSTLFTRRDEIELAWEFVEPIMHYWGEQGPPEFPNYPAGTWGPIHGKDFFRPDVCYSLFLNRMDEVQDENS
ncbi:MAG: glucose-6-phosphate dehydrogenase [Planctomycetes bacterium]|nr:glucose-6-phosphate dehydrogenase [Planctomycetota bacterium]